jgi:fused signal recognition particle receptor
MQVEQFGDTVPLTGVVLTKLDGTARGGIVLAVEKDLGVPVKFVGVGEAMEDLRPFDPGDFVDDLLEI